MQPVTQTACANPRPRRESIPFAARPIPVATLLLAVGLLASCSTMPDLQTEDGVKKSGGRQLNGSEVRARLGKPVRYQFEVKDGQRGNARVDGRGNVRMIWETGAADGKLRFTPSGYCNQIIDHRKSPESCYRVYQNDPSNWTIFRETGEYAGRILFED